jgi:hypothetical protein
MAKIDLVFVIFELPSIPATVPSGVWRDAFNSALPFTGCKRISGLKVASCQQHPIDNSIYAEIAFVS